MKTGIIMEVNERFLTLLTPDGEFLRARKLDRDYQIGQEIDFFPINQEETKKQSFFSIFNSFKAKTAFAAALIFMLVSVTLLPFFGNNKVYAYMSIDINPSIELGVNKKFQVVEILPYNEEGKEIVNELHDWKKKDIQELTNEIFQEIKARGYTKNNHEIVIGTAYEKKGQQQEENQQWEKEIAEIRNDLKNENLELKIVNGSMEERNKANDMGLTMGLYKEKENKEKENKVKEEKVNQKVLNNEKRDQQRANEIRGSEKQEEKDNREMHKQTEKEIREKDKQIEKENREREKKIETVIRERHKQTEKENRESKKQIENENKEQNKQIEKENKEREKQMEKENDEKEQHIEKEGIEKQKEIKKENKQIEKQKIKGENQKQNH